MTHARLGLFSCLVLSCLSVSTGSASDYHAQRLHAKPTFAFRLIDTIAGNGPIAFCGDGERATLASLNDPRGIAIGASGEIYIADTWHHRVRMVDPRTGLISTVAGNGEEEFFGDGGQATSASLNDPGGVVVGPKGELYIADTWNHRVRMVDRDGVITTIAGSGARGFSGDKGAPTTAALSVPYAVGFHNGKLYIADSWNHRVRSLAGQLSQDIARLWDRSDG